MNIVRYDGHDYFDYADYWKNDDINIFIGGRMTGKTYSIDKHGILRGEYEYNLGVFTRSYGNHLYRYPISMVPFAPGIILSFITMGDYHEWYNNMQSYILKLINMTEIKGWRIN